MEGVYVPPLEKIPYVVKLHPPPPSKIAPYVVHPPLGFVSLGDCGIVYYLLLNRTFFLLPAVIKGCLGLLQKVIDSHEFPNIVDQFDVNDLDVIECFIKVCPQLVWRSAILFWDSAYHQSVADFVMA